MEGRTQSLTIEGSQPQIVGRREELAAIDRFFERPLPGALLIDGDAGMGKTTLWRRGVAEAADRSYRVLACRPAESEVPMSFAALADLLDGALAEVVEALPGPQRRALEAALQLSESPGVPPSRHAIALGFLTAVRELAAGRPTLIAIDDVQWLDEASSAVLRFAARRLDEEPVRFLLAHRTESSAEGPAEAPLELERALPPERMVRLSLAPLSLGAVGHLLKQELGVAFSRPMRLRIHDTAGGNPLFALEVARALLREGETRLPPGPLPVPSRLVDLVRERLDGLPADVRQALLLVAASARPTVSLVAAALGDGARAGLKLALDAHVLEVFGDRLAFAHPLLASAVYTDADPAELRRTHSILSAVSDDPEERGRHLALAADRPDEAVANALEEAASATRRRGARAVCAELFEAAARLTPEDDARGRGRRMIAAAVALFEAADTERARDALQELVRRLPDGPELVEARWRLGTVLDDLGRWEDAMRLWQETLDATGDAAVVADLARSLAITSVYTTTVAEAIQYADDAVRAAEECGDVERLAYALGARAFAGAVAGDPAYGTFVRRALALEPSLEIASSEWSPSAVAAECARLAFDIDEARLRFRLVLERAEEEGNAEVEQFAAYGLATAELLAGSYKRAEELSAVVLDLAETTGVMRLPAARLRGQIDVHVGRSAEARAGLGAALAEAESQGETLHESQARSVLGLLALSEGDAVTAAEELAAARSLAGKIGMGHAAILRMFVDEVEAAAAAGRALQVEQAASAIRDLGDSPAWSEPLLLRVEAARSATRGELDQAEAFLVQALAVHPEGFLPLERGRTLLALGAVHRRARRRAAARQLLEDATATFEQIGAALWAKRARAELARIGGRTSSGDELTVAEQRIAELVVTGRTNREVAAELFVTVRTVEAALTRIYRKLDVRSRTELARVYRAKETRA
jgi:DNA-binding CsgD family transcriptional regulator